MTARPGASRAGRREWTGLGVLVLPCVLYAVVAAVPQERAGAATAVTETSAEIGGALGIALLGVVGTAVYRSRVAGAVPAGVPAHAAQAARDTLGGAVAVAGRLPGRGGAALASAARQSFGSGLHVVFAISAILSLAAAAVTLLRHLRLAGPDGEPEAPPDAIRAGGLVADLSTGDLTAAPSPVTRS
ncbi:MAG TPA: hypothetical protein VMK84_19005 [Streptosporangiaceae bacterium]|nr:hypothetical protein [Streptosporangiaceae bacterium]